MFTDLLKLKVILSLIVVLSGTFIGVSLTNDSSASSSGTFTVDFGNYTLESDSSSENSNAYEALISLCNTYSFDLVFSTDGAVEKINGQPSSGDSRTWGLYTQNSKAVWQKYEGNASSLKISSYAGVSWGLCKDGETPTTVVDASGYSFYGYGTAKRIVCLAPSCTETVCALGGEELIVGTDRYSNYPASVEQKREAKLIAEVGSYTSPSYEAIVQLDPDLVIGISSQYSHVKVINKLREVGINCVVTGGGEDLKTVYDNTYMVGIAMGLTSEAVTITQSLKEQVEQTYSIVAASTSTPSVMTSLSADKAPWVAGQNTYVSDIYSKSGARNAFGQSVDGWRQINAEMIVDNNPQYIIIISEGSATAENYQTMLDSLSKEWQSSDAYKNGNIYMFCDSAADMLQRPSTRLAQLTEIIGRICHESSFSDSIEIPKYIGDNYTDYITYSKEL